MHYLSPIRFSSKIQKLIFKIIFITKITKLINFQIKEITLKIINEIINKISIRFLLKGNFRFNFFFLCFKK